MADCPTIDEVLAMPKSSWKTLGSGGQGVVYKIGNYVLKIMALKDQKAIDAFQVEKEILEEISENPLTRSYVPELCSFDIKETFGNFKGYILQKYEKTKTLKEVIEDLEDSSEQLSFEIGSQLIYNLLQAILRINIIGYVHRDIKPENILIRTGKNIEKPILIDFGLACKQPCEDVPMAGTLQFIPKDFLPRSYHRLPNPYRVKTSVLPYESKKLFDKYAMMLTIEELLPFIDFETGTEAKIEEKKKFKQSILEAIAKTKNLVMLDAAAIKGKLTSKKYNSNANTRRRLENLNTSVRNKMVKQNAGSRKRRNTRRKH